jgi:heavy metal sensor kinase
VNRLSIRLRIALWNTAAFAVILVGFGLAVYGMLRTTHYDQVDRSLQGQLPGVIARLSAAAAHEAPKPFAEVRGYSAYLIDDQRHVVGHSADLSPADMVAVAAPTGVKPRLETAQLPTAGHVRRLVARDAQKPAQTVVLLAKLEHVDEELWEVIRALLITAPVALLAAASLSYFLAYKALSPVDELRRMTDQITAERLDRRLPVGNAADELGLLARTINSMMTRLERSFGEIRRFTADASHELRTPVAVIRSEAELGLSEVAGNDRTRRRLESIVEECSRLANLTSQLLTLCREEAGLAQLTRIPVALDEVVFDAAQCVRPMADAKQHRLETNLQSAVTVQGDAARLHQVLTNLLQNAIKYSPAGGSISVSLREQDGQALLAVQDSGIGIAPEHLPHVFERFYQASTGGAQAAEGAGLGLSIAKSIVEAHRGHIDVTSQLGVGTLFRVCLPIAPTAARNESGHDRQRRDNAAETPVSDSNLAHNPP